MMTNTAKTRVVDLMLNHAFTFNSFIVDKNNRLAYEVANDVASIRNKPAEVVIFYGKEHVGKTHLLQAIAHRFLEEQPDREVVYISVDNLYRKYKRLVAVLEDTQAACKEIVDEYADVDLLLIDNIDFFLS